DFNRKEGDIIDLSAIDAKPGGGDNAFKYIGDDKFTKKGQVSFKNGKVKLNTDNDAKAEAVLMVDVHKMSASDFDL
ncbi:MAG: calcium-binding protein, partial [Bauldia sp.]|nr:calcium-binding protein [Bauldia sp.]